MLKYVFIILNVAFVAGFKSWYSGEKTEVVQSMPTSALTGTEYIQEITITKPNEIKGFAKFEQQLPKGFVAVPVDIKDGLFSQNEFDVVKIIWYKMPDLNEFKIKFRVIVDYETSLNEYAISSRFSFLENNERKSITSNISKILIQKGSDKPQESEEVEITPLADTTLHRALTDNIDKMLREAGVACTQVSEMINKTEAKISIRVVKGKVTGFAKIEEPVCEGLTAINLENGGGVFSFADNKVKYVWTDLAPGESVTVSFKLVRNKEAGWLNRCTVEGEFAYLDGEKSLRCDFNSVTIDFNKGVTVANVPMPASAAAQMALGNSEPVNPANSPSAQRIAPPIVTPPVVENKIEETIVTPMDEKAVKKVETASSEAPIKSIEKVHEMAKESADETPKTNREPQSIGGLVFKVQVCATQKNVEAPFIQTTYKLPETVSAEMHEGWHKFTVGGYPQYVEAKDKRAELAPYNLPGPFVTAYNNGLRITVQEALMISKQQWVK